MDEDLKELELELENLRPRCPAPELSNRIHAELVRKSPSRRAQWLPWLALPIAAAAIFALTLTRQAKSSAAPGTSSPGFRPVAAENLLLEAREEGLVTLADGTTARRVRQSYLDTITWRDPRSDASLTWSLPREEVRVVPVVFQ